MTTEKNSGSDTAVKQPPNAQRTYQIDRKDLPLHCPLPEMSLWNSHPRVYLPIAETGKSKCPYCGAEFALRD